MKQPKVKKTDITEITEPRLGNFHTYVIDLHIFELYIYFMQKNLLSYSFLETR